MTKLPEMISVGMIIETDAERVMLCQVWSGKGKLIDVENGNRIIENELVLSCNINKFYSLYGAQTCDVINILDKRGFGDIKNIYDNIRDEKFIKALREDFD